VIYEKPEILALSAINAINQTAADKGMGTILEVAPPRRFNATPAAYEADE
jgi:hypothetical protein